jgi:cytoskeletal protein CcmA (bactofilin family)
LIGKGTVGAPLFGSGTVMASGGTLDLTGTVNSGLALKIGTTTSSDLKLDGMATTTSAIAISNANQKLEIGSSGNLTIGAAESISNGKIQLDGGTLTDASGLAVGSGASVVGAGTMAAALSGIGAVTASGGTLDLTKTVSSGPSLGINTTVASDLKIDGTAVAASAIPISSANQTLEIGTNGNLAISAKESITNGTIRLDGGSLIDPSGISVGGGAHLTGFGAVSAGTTAANDVDGTGSITANGGTLEFKTAVDGTAASAFDIANVVGSVLKFDSTVGATSVIPTITFDGAGSGVGTLDLTSTTLANFHGIVANFTDGDQIKVANATRVSLDSTGTILTAFNGSTTLGTITFSTSHTGDTFTVSGGTITVVGPPSATESKITASPTSLTADGVSTTTLTVTARDAQGNPIAGTAVTLSANGSDNTFGPVGGSGTTNASGVFTTTLASTLAQTETITATEGSAQETTTVTFAAGPPSATTSIIAANPTTVRLDGTATTTLTVTVKDAQGNPVGGTAVTLTASGSDNTFLRVGGMTNASGVFTTTLASTLAQTETVTATEGSAQETTTVTFAGDNYVWATVAGSWDNAANWNDTTAGQSPAVVAPGSNDIVTINAVSGGAFNVITGVGNSASLTIDGATSLAGQFTTGTLTTVGNAPLVVGSGDALTVTGDANVNGPLTVDGTLMVTGDANVNGPLTVDGTLTVTGDANVNDLTLGGTLTVDGTLSTSASIVGGTLTAGSLGAGEFDLSAGKLAITGNVTGDFNISGGTVTVGGTFLGSSIYVSGGSVQLAEAGAAFVNLGNLTVADRFSSLEIGTAGGFGGAA